MPKIKNWLFGKEKPKDTESIAKIRRVINKYTLQSRRLSQQADEQKDLAKEMMKSGNKAGAKQALMRRQLYLKKLNETQNKILNLQGMIESISEAKDVAETTKAIQEGVTVIEDTLKDVSPADTERAMLEMQSSMEKVSFASEALADTSFSETELDIDMEDAIDQEMKELEMELSLGQVEELPDVSTTTPIRTTPQKERKEKDEVSEEISELRKKIERERSGA
ncbi:MAG: SNF7 family protein [Candidatus Heimdallarchaeota archaeon]|nr:SNF7 family protein [Candidatus Heimdallarchaeota archaeon]